MKKHERREALITSMPAYLSIAPAKLRDAVEKLEREQMIEWDSRVNEFVPGVNVYEWEPRLTSFETHVLDRIVGAQLRAQYAEARANINATMLSGLRARRRSGRLEP